VSPEKAIELDFCRVDAGDVVIAKVGDPPGTATVYPVGEPSGIVTQDVIRIRVNKRIVSAQYLAFFLNSSAGRGLIDNIAIESTRMRISLGDYKNSLSVLPPFLEQQAITDYLQRETEKIDQMVAKVEAAIERLLEYRTALITAAVTGKIDVRGLVTVTEQLWPRSATEAHRQNIPNTV
jgi:type I restriction enzyme S subunit